MDLVSTSKVIASVVDFIDVCAGRFDFWFIYNSVRLKH